MSEYLSDHTNEVERLLIAVYGDDVLPETEDTFEYHVSQSLHERDLVMQAVRWWNRRDHVLVREKEDAELDGNIGVSLEAHLDDHYHLADDLFEASNFSVIKIFSKLEDDAQMAEATGKPPENIFKAERFAAFDYLCGVLDTVLAEKGLAVIDGSAMAKDVAPSDRYSMDRYTILRQQFSRHHARYIVEKTLPSDDSESNKPDYITVIEKNGATFKTASKDVDDNPLRFTALNALLTADRLINTL